MAVAAEGTSRRRILDYLNDGEEFGAEGPSSSAAARSLLPRFRWARLVRLGGKGRDASGKGKGWPPKALAEEETVAPEEEGVPRDASGASASSAACAAAASEGSGADTTRPSDLSVGLSLVFLLAKTSDEFNKMARVRAEMEALIRDFKGQQAMATTKTGADDEPRNIQSAASSCLTDGNEPQAETARCEDHRRRQHHHQAVSSSGAEMEAASRRRMDVLEEEFHAELERVRASYGTDTPPFPQEEDRDGGGAEPSDDDDIADCRQGFESDLGDDDGQNDDDHDEEEEDDDDDADRYGVSAVELERRLHELLHQRNQERIEELEAALRRAEKRLFDKEMEASLWKDTAKMAFRHDRDHDDDDDDDSP